VGIARRSLERAVQYAKERKVFQRAIGSNQGIAFPLAEGFAQYSVVSLLLDRVAQMYESGVECGVEATMLKYLAADIAYNWQTKQCKHTAVWGTPRNLMSSAIGARHECSSLPP